MVIRDSPSAAGSWNTAPHEGNYPPGTSPHIPASGTFSGTGMGSWNRRPYRRWAHNDPPPGSPAFPGSFPWPGTGWDLSLIHICSGWNYGRLDDPDKAEYNYVKDVDYISGAAILLSRKLWNQIGGFDDRFAPAYCEDSDLAFEVRKAGLRVVYPVSYTHLPDGDPRYGKHHQIL